MASNYNRVPRPAAVLVTGGNASLIIRRETVADLLRQDCLPETLRPKAESRGLVGPPNRTASQAPFPNAA